MELYTSAELAKRLGTKLYRLKYQRRFNRFPFIREGIRVRYRWSDIARWQEIYLAVKEWKENLIFLREIGTQSLEAIPKAFHGKPIWLYLFYSEIFGSPCHRKNDDPTINLFFSLNHHKLLEEILTDREQKIFMHRIRMTDEGSKIRFGSDEADPIPLSFDKIRRELNEKTKQVLHKIYRRAVKKIAANIAVQLQKYSGNTTETHNRILIGSFGIDSQ